MNLEDAAPVSGLALAVAEAQSINDALSSPASLKAAGQALVAHCAAIRCEFVVAASRPAESLVAAAMLFSDGAVRGLVRGSILPGRVLIVDSAVITANAVHIVGDELRAAGADWLGAAVLHRTRPDLDRLNAEIFDSVTVLG
jgi:hypothetical protein